MINTTILKDRAALKRFILPIYVNRFFLKGKETLVGRNRDGLNEKVYSDEIFSKKGFKLVYSKFNQLFSVNIIKKKGYYIANLNQTCSRAEFLSLLEFCKLARRYAIYTYSPDKLNRLIIKPAKEENLYSMKMAEDILCNLSYSLETRMCSNAFYNYNIEKLKIPEWSTISFTDTTYVGGYTLSKERELIISKSFTVNSNRVTGYKFTEECIERYNEITKYKEGDRREEDYQVKPIIKFMDEFIDLMSMIYSKMKSKSFKKELIKAALKSNNNEYIQNRYVYPALTRSNLLGNSSSAPRVSHLFEVNSSLYSFTKSLTLGKTKLIKKYMSPAINPEKFYERLKEVSKNNVFIDDIRLLGDSGLIGIKLNQELVYPKTYITKRGISSFSDIDTERMIGKWVKYIVISDIGESEKDMCYYVSMVSDGIIFPNASSNISRTIRLESGEIMTLRVLCKGNSRTIGEVIGLVENINYTSAYVSISHKAFLNQFKRGGNK